MSISLESEINNFIIKSDEYSMDENNCDSYKALDFAIKNNNERFYIEAKEKKSKIKASSWGINGDESNYFILDDLTTTKMVFYAPWAFLVIKNQLNQKYYITSVIDLMKIPKQRGNREIRKGIFKGKWVISLKDLYVRDTFEECLSVIKHYMNNKDKIINKTECFGNYPTEKIKSFGQLRTKDFRKYDYETTR